VTRPDAEFVEVRQQSRAYPRKRDFWRKREKAANVPNRRNFPVRPYVSRHHRVARPGRIATIFAQHPRRSFPWTASSISSDWSSSSWPFCPCSACG